MSDLYEEVILDHYKRPRNAGKLAIPECNHAEGANPLCGDNVTIYVTVRDDKIEDVRFEGGGCAIATASASLMTESIKGKPLAEAKRMFEEFHAMVTGKEEEAERAGLGKLTVFSNICHYPARVKCATLAWHTLDAALTRPGGKVSTE